MAIEDENIVDNQDNTFDNQQQNIIEEEKPLSNTNQDEIKCYSCGGSLKYVPGINKLKCEYCGCEIDIEDSSVEIKELDFDEYLKNNIGSIESHTIHTVECQNCGAHLTLAENVVSDKCPFCGSVFVVTNTISETQIKPGSLLPFNIDKKKAFEGFKKWIKDLWFAPNDLSKKMTDIKELSGIYVPYWTYDADTHSIYQGKRGDDYYVTETYTEMVNGRSVTRTRSVRHTRWRSVSGQLDKFFDDVLVVASKSVTTKYVNELEPWDLKNLVPYDEKYLSGFRAETYQVDLKDGFGVAKSRMESSIESSIKSQIGGDHQIIFSKSTEYSNITFKHILLPIYISAYKYKNKVYQILVNARTGEVQGDRPYSAWKIFFFSLIIIATIAGIYMLFT